ncbi:MAG: nucleotidyltransferase family protein [Crocosphaera sp.]|nr:nucleotidyltransferase family protein [Crocosphaera sp.]
MSCTLPIPLNLDKIAEFCRTHHIRKLSLFGSVLRDDFTHQSDVDVLVEFEQGKTPGLAIITMEDELSSIINKKIDLRTPKDLSRYFREQVMQEAMVIYEQN